MAPNTAAQADPNALTRLRQSGKMIAKDAGGKTVADFFEMNKTTIQAVLPAHMTPDRMLKIALRALRTTPKLMGCTVESLFGAVVTCAQLGLEPNTPQGHIYLIPFENKRKGITEVQIVIGYKGLIDLARRSGEIETIAARVAYKGDDFSIEYGTVDEIHHKPNIGAGEPGDPIGVYAVAKLKGGGYQFEWMSVGQINQIRNGSQGYKTAVRFNKQDTPWITHWEEMAKKTVVRRLCKYLPMSIELATATALDDRAETKTQGLDQVLDGDFTVLADDSMEGGDEADPETGEIKTTAAIEQSTEQPMDTGPIINNEREPEPAARQEQPQQQEVATRTADPAGTDKPAGRGRGSKGNDGLFSES